MRLEPVAVYKSPDGRFFVRLDQYGDYRVFEWPSEKEVSHMPLTLRQAIQMCDQTYRERA